MLENGLMITVIGMGVVFSFLCILVIAMHVSAKIMTIVNKFFPEPVLVTAKAKVSSSSEEEIAVAIAAAKALI